MSHAVGLGAVLSSYVSYTAETTCTLQGAPQSLKSALRCPFKCRTPRKHFPESGIFFFFAFGQNGQKPNQLLMKDKIKVRLLVKSCVKKKIACIYTEYQICRVLERPSLANVLRAGDTNTVVLLCSDKVSPLLSLSSVGIFFANQKREVGGEKRRRI